MTKRTGGASAPAIESFGTLLDGYLDNVGTTSVPLTTVEEDTCYQVLVQSAPDNTVNVRVGNRHSQSIILEPGDAETIPFSGRLSDIYVRTVSGTARINWHAMR